MGDVSQVRLWPGEIEYMKLLIMLVLIERRESRNAISNGREMDERTEW